MFETQRHKLVFKLAPIIDIFLKLRFSYEYEKLNYIDGPYLLLSNHNMELDPLLIGVATRKQLYFVASEHILRKGIGTWLIMKLCKPIIHKKGKQGINTLKEMIQILKNGGNICMFPEGNRSFNGVTYEIMESIGKIAKYSGVKVITYKIEGGYLSQPRWSTTLRKGKITGKLMNVYTPEEIQNMKANELTKMICQDLYEDAYKTQKKKHIKFKGKNLALGMESTIFACPECKQISTLRTDKNYIYCKCGFKAKYDVYGILTDIKEKEYTITELDTIQKETLQKKLLESKDNEILFEDKVIVHKINNKHKLIETKTSDIKAYKDSFEFCNKRIKFKDIQGIAIVSRNTIILHIKDNEGHLELKSNTSFSALKYLYLYKYNN